MNYQPYYITSYQSGLKKSKKPFLIFDDAFQTLENAYVWRERVKKREGIKLLSRLRRPLTGQALGNADGSGNFSGNIITILSLEATASIAPSSITITAGANTLTEPSTPDGTLTGAPSGSGIINYATGDLTLSSVGAAAAITITFSYFPNLPVQGIDYREQAAINVEETVIFDTKYVYNYTNSNFETASSTTWAGNDTNFFWMANYRGSDANTRLFFVTNYTSPGTSTDNRIRYTSNLSTWTDFTPAVDSTNSIFGCRLIISYYGRLLFFNTYEGATAGTSSKYFNRCRFSQIGSPVAVDAWRSDQFGKGGFIDAPTNEEIVSLRFYKNTLIVFFEKTTWQLRYVGDYGLPFIWERISSDFGSESTFSTILFDSGVLAVGDKAIVASSGNDVQRIDLDIPDEVFSFQNSSNGKERVQAVRDFQKEIVYWSYVTGGDSITYPDTVLVYNYRNNSWAKFRDNVTALGPFQVTDGVSWDESVSWDSPVQWDTNYNEDRPTVISGNQQGFIHYYQVPVDAEAVLDHQINFREHESLYISDVTRSATNPILIESPNHNLKNNEIIYITGLIFVNVGGLSSLATSLNNKFYSIQVQDADTFYLYQYDIDTDTYISTSHDNIGYTPAPGTGTYYGGGVIGLMQNMDIVTKDFNPYADKGVKVKSSYTDFQTDMTPNGECTVNIFVDSAINSVINTPFYNPVLNTTSGQVGNITNITQANPASITSANHGLQTGRTITIGDVTGMTEINSLFSSVTVTNQNTFTLDSIDSSAFTAYTSGGYWQTTDTNPFYVNGSRYGWHRVYSNVFGSYLTYQITYNDALMNNPVTHNTDFELNAMILYMKPGGKLP